MSNFQAECEIRSLLVRERYYRDTAQWAKLRDAWHPDASKTRIKISWYEGDIDGFITGSKAMVKGGTSAFHTISPIEIHINGDKALSESLGSIQIRVSLDGKEYDCISHARFISRLLNVGSRWVLASLEVIYDRDSLVPTAPFGGQAIEMDVSGHRKSYKYLSWLLGMNGQTIAQDLPGTDRPEAVEKVMAGNYAWLE
ncbi:hypothetical protein BDV18DRAFT_95084 [Aspergillus unguis]